MRFSVVTLFPEMFESVLDASILGKARAAGLIEVDFVNPRDFATDAHRTVDDAPYGSGPGMVMQCGPLMEAIETLPASAHKILLAPVGGRFDARRARALAEREHLVLVCGRYEGVDERVVELGIDESLSIGDYVLTGGELGAMVIIDAVARHVPGVLGEADSTEEESFEAGLLEYPHYTRPREFRGLKVPEVLLSGHHARIAEWRHREALRRTAKHRPDLLAHNREVVGKLAARTYVILAHHPVLDRFGETVTTSVTNFDIHDIARAAATYGLAGYLPVTPVALQREKIERIVSVWREEISQTGAENRGQALGTISVCESIGAALDWVESAEGRRPLVVATTARRRENSVGTAALRALATAEEPAPLVLIFGTGWGLEESVFSLCDQVLEPVVGVGEFNHLSVRSAVSAYLDRLFAAENAPDAV
jgi:tRNA (guanine37-N1)-methyltransferase